MKLRSRVSIAMLFVVLLLPALAAQTPRDVRKEPSGNASISGIVQTAEATPRPLRLVAVTLSSGALFADRQFYTGNDGRFEFANLPPGQYTLSAFKSGYMREAYGAKRQGGAGATIAVTDGQKVEGVAVGLSKYGVISGTIYDQNGEPAQGVSVEVLAYTMRTGRRTLSSVYGRPQTTDDRGVFRAGGLVPGDYFVAAGPSPDNGSTELQVLSPGDIDRALQGSSGGASSSSSGAARSAGTRVSFAPVFYPGATDLASATKVTLKLGEERSGIDFALRLTPSARIDGTVTTVDGQPAPNAQIVATMVTEAYSLDLFKGTIGNTRPDAQGRFSYSGLSPGHYVITARTAPDTSAASRAAGPLWASADVDVGGADQSVALTLQPGVTVSGKIVFDGTTLKPPASAATARITMPAVQASGIAIGVSPPAINADGTFTIAGAPPGSYKLTAAAPQSASGWMPRSATVNGVDALDLPFDVRPNQPVDGVVVTFTDHPTELSGLFQTPAGVPTADYFIIVFAADKTFWTPSSRRVVMVRPSSDGKYLVRNLPPGEYRVAAVTDIEFNAWFDPGFLTQIVVASTPVTLAEGEKKTLDLRIGG